MYDKANQDTDPRLTQPRSLVWRVAGDGKQGYAFVGTIPVTEDPDGPRIYKTWKESGVKGIAWLNAHLSFAIILWDDALHQI